ncbi:MAG: hypothetical protein PHF67_04635 [Candidatus Nanoarchaeia archaeon]|nr:hypothetical protein [Candidatus Nanoarchaeia archaeon]
MTLTNYEGEREATTHNSSSYGKKIIEFMELRGYFLVKDSDTDGIFQDKVFRKPDFDGERETYVEVKYTELSLSNTDFLSEFGKYFVMYMENPNKFYFKIFTKKLINLNRWKAIFDDAISKYQEVKKFRSSVRDVLSADLKQKFNLFDDKNFKAFVGQIDLVQIGYEKLVQKINDLKENKKFNNNESYLEEKHRLVYQKEKILGNIYSVGDLPKVYTYDFKGDVDENFWYSKDSYRFFPYKDKVISIYPLTEDIIKRYSLKNCKNKKIDDLDLDSNEKLNLKKRVVELFIISKGENVNYTFLRDYGCLYVIYDNVNKNPLKFKGKEGHKKRVVARPYYNGDKLNFVTHRALKFRVTDFDNDIYIIFNFFRLFSKDGKKLIEGENAKRLHYRFKSKTSSNFNEHSLLDFLITLLDLKTKSLNYDNFIPTKQIELESPCKAAEGELFDERESLEDDLEDEDE